jgi:hypothetical protein
LHPNAAGHAATTLEAILIIRDFLGGKLRFCSQPFKRGKSLRPLGAWSENYWPAIKSAQAASIRKTPRCLANPHILGRLQPLSAGHLPPLQNNMSRAGGALLGLGQWEGEKEGKSFGGARCMNAAA